MLFGKYKKASVKWETFVNAGDRNRTDTIFLSRDFKSRASASSATPAKKNNDPEETRTLDLRRDRAAL